MRIKDNYILKKIAGSYVVVPVRTRAVDFSGIIKLSDTGAFLWKLLEEDCEKDRLVSEMLKEYEVDEATASRDIDRFLAALKEADLLE